MSTLDNVVYTSLLHARPSGRAKWGKPGKGSSVGCAAGGPGARNGSARRVLGLCAPVHQNRDSERACVWGAGFGVRVCRTAAFQVPNQGRCTRRAVHAIDRAIQKLQITVCLPKLHSGRPKSRALTRAQPVERLTRAKRPQRSSPQEPLTVMSSDSPDNYSHLRSTKRTSCSSAS